MILFAIMKIKLISGEILYFAEPNKLNSTSLQAELVGL
jgi:hypothetical protein